jgi:LPXTG-motif cell wall-anchored protein
MAGHGGGNFSGSKTKAGYANSGAPRPGGYVGGGNDGYGSGGKDGAVVSHSAPGPILGLGIPALVVAGGYVLLRRRRK